MEFQKFNLGNSLPVIAVSPPNADIASVLFLVRAGSRYETKETDGLSRFYANMSLKKTKSYFTKLALVEEIDKIGAFFNLEINKEYTAFYIKSPAAHIEAILNLISEIIIHPSFDINEVSQEKSFFTTEIQNRLADPSSVAFDEINKLVFGDHPLSFSGVGSKDAVEKFKLDSLFAFKQKFYNAQNSCLVVCSDNANLQDMASKAFSPLEEGQKVEFDRFDPGQYKGQIKAIDQNTPQSYFSLGFPSYERTSEKKLHQILLDTLIGKTKSNTRLVNISAEEALALYVGSGIYMFTETGLLNIQLRALPKNSKKAYKRVLEEIEKIKSKKVPDEELKKVKGFYKGSLLVSFSDPVEKAFFYGLQELLENRMISKEDFFQSIENVTQDQIKQAAVEILDEDKLSVVMVGPKVQ